ncbi:MAG: DUF459 domain-containing protein [Rhizobiaceae bacterium]|nr:DUF459 domain-containing protein [Rhizobiaceae bacterium]
MAAAPWLVVHPTPAFAQEESARPRTIFGLLFGRRDRATERQPESTTRSRARPSASASAAAAPEPEAVEKLPNARVVLVVGDFLADGLAEGLTTAYAQSPGVRIVARANGSSGFVRDDYYDWQSELGPILDEEKPAIVVFMIGSNDRQQLVVDETREKVRSEKWTEEYTRRVENIAKQVRDRNLPLFWVGLPSFKSSSMSTDMLAFNDIYRTVTENVGGEFIDIWDGFVDENGAFSSVGPDMNGQRVRLRGSDGINLTRAGKRKVAFYVERPLNRVLGPAVGSGVASLGPNDFVPMLIEPEQIPDITRTNPIALGGAELDGGESLLGAGRMVPPREARTLVEKLAVEGIAPPAHAGRADDFSTPPYAATPQASPASTETTTAISD